MIHKLLMNMSFLTEFCNGTDLIVGHGETKDVTKIYQNLMGKEKEKEKEKEKVKSAQGS